MVRGTRCVAAIALIALIVPVAANTTTIDGVVRFTASDVANGASYGYSLDLEGLTVVTAGRVFTGPPGGEHFGQIYINQRDAAGVWTEGRIPSAPGLPGLLFGSAVSIHQGDLLFGRTITQESPRQTVVHHATPDGGGGWTITTHAPDAPWPNDAFGESLDLYGGRFIVGAPFDGEQGANAGAAYLFEPDGAGGWSQQKLLADGGLAGDYFGTASAIHDDRIVIGAKFADVQADRSGAVYVFERNGAGGWDQQRLAPADLGGVDVFGHAIDMDGDRFVVGAAAQDAGGVRNAGAVYLYEKDATGGFVETRFTASDAVTDLHFGGSVAISGDTIAVGAAALWDDSDEEVVYVYRPDGLGGWNEYKITQPAADDLALFGRTVALSGSWLLVGAPLDAEVSDHSGAVYLFNLDADSDGDCATDLEERSAGTDPHDAGSFPLPGLGVPVALPVGLPLCGGGGSPVPVPLPGPLP